MLKVKAKYDEQLQTAIDSYVKAVQAIRSEYKESIAAEKVKEQSQKLRDKAAEIRKAYTTELDTLHDKTKKELESKEAERQLRLKQASTDERILMQLERLETSIVPPYFLLGVGCVNTNCAPTFNTQAFPV